MSFQSIKQISLIDAKDTFLSIQTSVRSHSVATFVPLKEIP